VFDVVWLNSKVRLRDVCGDDAFEECEGLVVANYGKELWNEQVATTAEGRHNRPSSTSDRDRTNFPQPGPAETQRNADVRLSRHLRNRSSFRNHSYMP